MNIKKVEIEYMIDSLCNHIYNLTGTKVVYLQGSIYTNVELPEKEREVLNLLKKGFILISKSIEFKGD